MLLLWHLESNALQCLHVARRHRVHMDISAQIFLEGPGAKASTLPQDGQEQGHFKSSDVICLAGLAPCQQAASTHVSCQHGSNDPILSAVPAANYFTLPAGGRDTRVLDAALRAVAQSTSSLGQVYDLLPPHVQRASQQLTPSQLRRLPSEFAGTASHSGLPWPPSSISGSSSRPSQSLHVSWT